VRVKSDERRQPPHGPAVRLWVWFWVLLLACVFWHLPLPVAGVVWLGGWYLVEMQLGDGWTFCRRCAGVGRVRRIVGGLRLCRRCKGHRQHVRLGWRIWDPLMGSRREARKAK